jgi:hypothetical protein
MNIFVNPCQVKNQYRSKAFAEWCIGYRMCVELPVSGHANFLKAIGKTRTLFILLVIDLTGGKKRPEGKEKY